MANYVVFGAGRQGTAAAWELKQAGGEVHVADVRREAVQRAREILGLGEDRVHVVDFTSRDQVMPLLKQADGAVFSADYSLNLQLSKWAIEAGTHAVDYGGNHDVVADQHALDDLARDAGVAIVPDTGLTPGLAGILVAGGVAALDEPREARIRVGGLPQDPRPPLNYAIVFSVRGLTNEYLEPSVVITDGRVQTQPSLSGLEEVRFGDRIFEAFLTSGGVSTLPKTFGDVLQELDCKTLRYPGHAELIRFAFDIGFRSEQQVDVKGTQVVPREVFEEMLLRALPHNPPDETLMRITVRGKKDGRETEAVYEMQDLYDEATGFTSMQRCTAFPGTLILRMLVEGDIGERGVLYQERAVEPVELVRRLGDLGIRIGFELKQV